MGLGPVAAPWLTAQSAGFALDDRKVMPPVVDRPRWQVMGALDQSWMFTEHLSLGGDDDPLGVDAQADGPVGKGCRHAVAIALEVDEAGRRHPLALLDEAVEGRRRRHQGGALFCPDIGNRARQRAMRDLAPEFDAAPFEPGVQGRQIGKVRHWLPEPVARVLDVLLDLPLLPARRRITELRLEDIVAGHGEEAEVDLPLLAPADAIDRCLHVVVDAPPGHAAEHTEAVPMRIEQHLVGLQQIGTDQEGPAVRQLDMRHLQLRALAAEKSPIFAPVELECLARSEGKRHEGAASRRLARALPIGPPVPGKGGDPVVGTGEAERHQIGVELLQRPPLLARLRGLRLQPARQLLGKGVKLARPFRRGELRLDRARLQILPDRVPRQPAAPRNLTDRQLLPQRHASDDGQKSHVDHSVVPPWRSAVGEGSHGSNLNGNQALTRVTSHWKSTSRTPSRPASASAFRQTCRRR